MQNQPSEEFENACYQASNALRLLHHGVRRGGQFTGDDMSLTLTTFQATTNFCDHEDAIVITVDPKPGIDDGHKRTRFLLTADNLPDSPIFTAPLSKLPDLIASYIEDILAQGGMTIMRHGDEDICLLFSPAHGSRAVVTQYVEAICRGIDTKYDPNSVMMRHPGFGVSGDIEMFSPDMQIVTPREDNPDPEERACAARLNMAKRWVNHLNPAIRIIPTNDHETFILSAFALTFAAPEDRSQAMSNASKAYMHLAAIVQSQADARA